VKICRVIGWAGGWMLLAIVLFSNMPPVADDHLIGQFLAAAVLSAAIVAVLIGIIYGTPLFKD